VFDGQAGLECVTPNGFTLKGTSGEETRILGRRTILIGAGSVQSMNAGDT